MRIGIIAGNRLLPIILAKSLKERNTNSEIVAICFKGETQPSITKYVDRTYWINVGDLGDSTMIPNRSRLERLGKVLNALSSTLCRLPETTWFPNAKYSRFSRNISAGKSVIDVPLKSNERRLLQ